MGVEPRTIFNIFSLDELDGFERAEKFKAKLESDGWVVTVQLFGVNSVKVSGVR